MRRLQAIAVRLACAGLAALSLGAIMVVASLVHGSGTPAFADSTPYELYCPGTPVGNIALNNVITTGTITPDTPAAGQQFDLTNYQSTVALPNSIVSAAAALGNSAIVGTATLTVDATGATPAAVSSPQVAIDATIPSPVPAAGLPLVLPSTPGSVGPFTATGGTITLTVDPTVSISLVVSGSNLELTCTPYPNNSEPTGIVTAAPTNAKASPVIAVATGSGTTTTEPATTSTTQARITTTTTEAPTTTTTVGTTTTTAPPQALTGAYELYCPNTPVGNIVLNDAVTSATLSPANPTSGQSFSITGYQTVVNLPSSLASAAAAVGGPSLTGSATAQIDASGATPAKTPEGPLDFNVPFPSPIPASGVSLSLPATAATIPGFTATGGGITIQEDSSASLSLTVAGNALALTCTAYPNDSVAASGITTVAPTNAAIAPVIALAGGGSTSTTTTTTVSPVTTTTVSPVTTTTGGTATTTSAPSGSATSTSTPAGSTTTTGATPGSTTTPATSHGASSTSTTSTHVVTAASNSLAFTGPGPGLKTMTLIGAAVMLLGLVILLLADFPRRVMSRLAIPGVRIPRDRSTGARPKATIVAGTAPPRAHPLETLFIDGVGAHLAVTAVQDMVATGSLTTDATTTLDDRGPVLSRLDAGPADAPTSADEERGEDADRTPELDVAALDPSLREGWWLATDGKWYAPEEHPEYLMGTNTFDRRTPEEAPPAAWYDDPLTPGVRYWDGRAWTSRVASRRSDEARPGTDPQPELPGWWLTSDDA